MPNILVHIVHDYLTMGRTDRSDDENRSEHGDEDPIPRTELEARNTERIVMIIEELNIDDNTIGSGGSKIAELVDQQGEKINNLLMKTILLVALITFSVVVWRIGTIVRVVGTIM